MNYVKVEFKYKDRKNEVNTVEGYLKRVGSPVLQDIYSLWKWPDSKAIGVINRGNKLDSYCIYSIVNTPPNIPIVGGQHLIQQPWEYSEARTDKNNRVDWTLPDDPRIEWRQLVPKFGQPLSYPKAKLYLNVYKDKKAIPLECIPLIDDYDPFTFKDLMELEEFMSLPISFKVLPHLRNYVFSLLKESLHESLLNKELYVEQNIPAKRFLNKR